MNDCDQLPEVLSPEFLHFVRTVSPEGKDGQQPVFFQEASIVLDVLWKIYSVLKDKGYISKWFGTAKVVAAMHRNGDPQSQHAALSKILATYR